MNQPSFTDDFSPLQAPAQVETLDFEKLEIWTRYRGHPELQSGDHIRLFQHEIVNALRTGGSCYAMLEGDVIQAICALAPLSWDSTHFDRPMSKISLSCSPDVSSSLLRQLVEQTIGTRSIADNHHISCELDIDDYRCLNTLLSMGAEVLDLKREYRAKSLKHIAAPKFMTMVRPYTAADRPSVLQILDTSRFATRFSRDSSLTAPKSKLLYQKWMEKILDSSDEERIALVAEKAGVIQACGTIEAQDLRHAGVDCQLMSGGIYVSRPEATGYYYPVIYGLIHTALTRHKTAQTCISLNNHSAVRVLEKMNFGTQSTRYALRLLR